MYSSKYRARLDVSCLKQWFLSSRRSLPWRENPTPYRVWVSEVLLQQTQALVVIPYFHRWMELFPTVEALALAPLQEVIKAVEGIGYYSRIRSIHAAARYIVQQEDAQLPSQKDQLLKIKGIGKYTAGAILNFAFHQKAAAIDGNVARVMSRYFLIEENIAQAKTRTMLEQLLEINLPDEEPWVIMEALIELGACICQKVPRCFLCPLKASCLGFFEQKAHLLPVKPERQKTTELKRFVGVLVCGTEILLRKIVSGKIMADLYEFPYFEEPFITHPFTPEARFVQELPMVKHSFTRFRAKLYPSVWEIKKQINIEGYLWVTLDVVSKLPFSSGHRKILTAYASII